MAFDISNPIGEGTDAEMLVAFRQCMIAIAYHGQSYQIGKRMFTRADLAEVRETIDWLEGKVSAAAATSGSATNYATRGRAL